MDECLDSAKLPKLNQEVKNLNRPLTNDIQMLTKSHPCKKKSPGPEGFTTEFYQTLKEDLQSFKLLEEK